MLGAAPAHVTGGRRLDARRQRPVAGARGPRDRAADLGIVVLTMHNDDETLLEALDAGASALVLQERARRTRSSPPYAAPPMLPGRVHRHGPRRGAAPPADEPEPKLTPRETEVLDRAGERRLGRRRSAKALFMSESTVKTHVGKVYEKLAPTTGPRPSWPRSGSGWSSHGDPARTAELRLPQARHLPVAGPSHGDLLASELREGLHHPDRAGADDDDEQRREDAQQQREEDLDRHLLGLLLGPLTPRPAASGWPARAAPPAIGRPSRSACTRRCTKFFTSGTLVRSPREANASPRDLPIWISESTRANSPAIGARDGAGHLHERRVETLPGLDTDREHVEGVGEPAAAARPGA